MSLPREYGGGDRAAVERFVVAEELLRWGAPVGHHWVADRQSGPLLAKVGTPEQRERFLPAICRGELSFCIGMSEPDSGSDLASVVTRRRGATTGGSSTAPRSGPPVRTSTTGSIALVRTSDAEDRHAGLSQVLIDLHAPGVEVNPIPFLDGTADFNEVVLTDVFVPDDRTCVGSVGNGWAQIGQELAFERGGPDRWLSTYLVLEQYLREHEPAELDIAFVELLGIGGRTVLGVAQPVVVGGRARSIAHEAAVGRRPPLVKEMGTRFEQDLLESIRRCVDVEPVRTRRRCSSACSPTPSSPRRCSRSAAAPSRSCAPSRRKGFGRELDRVDALLFETADRVFADTATFAAVEQAEADGWAPTIWDAVAETGLAWVSVPEAAGGSGGTLADAIEVVRIAGRHAVPLPLAETGMLGGWLLAGAGLEVAHGASPSCRARSATTSCSHGVLHGTAHRVPWAAPSTRSWRCSTRATDRWWCRSIRSTCASTPR